MTFGGHKPLVQSKYVATTRRLEAACVIPQPVEGESE